MLNIFKAAMHAIADWWQLETKRLYIEWHSKDFK